MSQSGDVVKVIATGTEYSSLELCSLIPVTQDLVIEGILGTPVINCTDDEFPTVFMIQSGEVKLKNLRISAGIVQTNGATLIVENSTFDEDAGIFAMTTFMMYYYKYEPALYSTIYLMEYIRLAMPYQFPNYACYATNITLINCNWTRRTKQVPAYLDMYLLEGLQVQCKEVNVNIDSTNFDDRNVYLSALSDLHVDITNSQFEGREEGLLHTGGILIETFPSLPDPDITVENCTFKHLRFQSRAYEAAWNYVYTVAALTIKVFPETHYMVSMDLAKLYDNFTEDVLDYEAALKGKIDNSMTYINGLRLVDVMEGTDYSQENCNIKIINSTFYNNDRAISVKYTPQRYRPSLIISGSTFQNNSAMLDGGAIHVSGLSYMRIVASKFVENSAGEDEQVIYTNKNVDFDMFKTFKFIILHYAIKECTFQMWYEDDTETAFVSRELTGEGGAIYVDNTFCETHDSEFYDNFASKYGGSIFGTISSHVGVFTSKVYNTKDRDSFDGTILKTYGTLMLIDSSFYITQASQKQASTINHFTEETQATVWVSNITIQCPENAQLYSFNVTGDWFSDTTQESDVIACKKLRYSCIPCPSGSYSLRSGYISVPDMSTNVSKVTSLNISFEYTSVKEVLCINFRKSLQIYLTD